METLLKKLNKHEHNRLDAILAITLQAMRDGQISNEKFKLVMKERKNVQNLLNEVRVEKFDRSLDICLI